MAASMGSYSVEQVELMRRLRLTGITYQQIIEGFETLDRLDRELAPYQQLSMPRGGGMSASNGGLGVLSRGSQPSATASATISGFLSNPPTSTRQITSIKTLASPYDSLLNRYRGRNPAARPFPNPLTINGHSRRKRKGSQTVGGGSIGSPPILQPNLNDDPMVNGRGLFSGDREESMNGASANVVVEQNPVWIVNPELEKDVDSTGDEDQSYLNGIMPELELLETDEPKTRIRGHRVRSAVGSPKAKKRRAGANAGRPRVGVVRRRSEPPKAVIKSSPVDYSQYVEDQQVEEFMSQGEPEMLRIIREFVTEKQLRQQAIAIMTNVSQPYVSRFLSGSPELSSRVRRMMYCWFLAVKNNPELLIEPSSTAAQSSVVDESGPPTMVAMNNSIFSTSSNIDGTNGDQSNGQSSFGFSSSSAVIPKSGLSTETPRVCGALKLSPLELSQYGFKTPRGRTGPPRGNRSRQKDQEQIEDGASSGMPTLSACDHEEGSSGTPAISLFSSEVNAAPSISNDTSPIAFKRASNEVAASISPSKVADIINRAFDEGIQGNE